MTNTLVATLVGAAERPFRPLVEGPPPSEDALGWVDAAVSAVAGAIAMPGTLLDAGVAAATSAVLPAGMGMPAATTMTGLHLGLPHYHPPTVCTGVPLPGMGPAMVVGALDVMIGGLPALRCGDVGFAFGCSGHPNFEVSTGSSNVFIGGKRAVRALDSTRHCNPMPLLAGVSAAAPLSLDLLSFATLTVSTSMHCVAAVASASDTSVSPDLAEERAGGELRQAAVGALQLVADTALSALTPQVGMIPAVGLTGDGFIVSGAPTVLIGGLPLPPLGDLLNTHVHGWMRRVARAANRYLHAESNGRWPLCGDPVDVSSGSVVADHLDVDHGLLAVRRHYDTAARDRPGPFGRGMRGTFERELDVWLHRVAYTDERGLRFELPAFRGRSVVHRSGCVVRRLDGDRYEVALRGETMRFVGSAGVRSARLLGIASARGELTLAHDAQGRVLRVGAGDESLAFVRGAGDQVTRIEDERGHERSAYAYDADGRLVWARNAEAAEELYAYDAEHRLTERRDARGYRVRWRYDPDGRCVQTRGEDGRWAIDVAYRGTTAVVTHASGLVEELRFDARGLLVQLARSDGSMLWREPDTHGRIVRERDRAGRVVDWLYDETDALVGKRDRFRQLSPPSGSSLSSPGARSLPATLGAQLGAWRARAGSLGLPQSETSRPDWLQPLAAWALPPARPRAPCEVSRDRLGRIVGTLDARGQRTRQVWDAAGALRESIDRDGRAHRFEVSRAGLPEREIDPLGRTLERTYTATDEVASYRAPLGSTTHYERDPSGRVARVVRNGALREEYVRDVGDRLVEKRDGGGRTLLRITPHANALPGVIALASGDSLELDYDARGRITRARSSAHDARLARDDANRIVFDRRGERGVRRVFGDSRETTCVLDRFETRVERSGARTLVCDPTGRTSALVAGGGRLVRTLANGTTETLAFDDDGRLEGRIAHREDGSRRAWAARYERSPEGDLLSVWDSALGPRRFDVDAAHRLAAERGADGRLEPYTLDAADNVVSKPGLARAELTRASVLLRTESESFEHDARARMSVRRGADGHETRYGYDALDQLISVEWSDGRAPWRGTYDGLGRLCRFGRSGEETELFWDGDRIAAELAADGALRVHVHAEVGALIPLAFVDYASVDAAPGSGHVHFVFHDASGMPIAIEDASGEVAWRAERVEPFGALTVAAGARLAYALRWPGHLFDPALGLHHNRFRAYDPGLARYLQPDPIGHGGSPHSLYAYLPNPLVAVDLLGLECPYAARPRTEEEASDTRPLTELPPGTWRDAEGRLRGRDGRFVTDPSASELPDVLHTRLAREPTTASLDCDSTEVRALLAARRVARSLGRAPGARWAANRATERLGTLASEAYVHATFPGAELLHQGRGRGTFDAIYRLPGDPPRILVVEAKGGSGTEGSAVIADGRRVEQGTPEYRDHTAGVMRARAERTQDTALQSLAETILASRNSTMYLGVSQPLDAEGNPRAIRAYDYGDSIERRTGDVSRRGGARAPPAPS